MGSKCFGRQWDSYAHFQAPGLAPSADEADVKKQMEKIFKTVDKDGSGVISKDEILAYLRTPAGSWGAHVHVSMDMNTDTTWKKSPKKQAKADVIAGTTEDLFA